VLSGQVQPHTGVTKDGKMLFHDNGKGVNNSVNLKTGENAVIHGDRTVFHKHPSENITHYSYDTKDGAIHHVSHNHDTGVIRHSAGGKHETIHPDGRVEAGSKIDTSKMDDHIANVGKYVTDILKSQ
jgi:hypothetical protein